MACIRKPVVCFEDVEQGAVGIPQGKGRGAVGRTAELGGAGLAHHGPGMGMHPADVSAFHVHRE
jgi:hypothetical protein